MSENRQVKHVEVPDRLRSAKKRVPKPVKRSIRSGVRQYAVLTASQRVEPDFLIIGTKRGGTTSLWNWLVRHPAVAPMYPGFQQIKSPHYFDINYSRGPKWYRSHFVTRRALDRQRERVGAVVTGEASPYYMFHPMVPQRVAQELPAVKLIVLLREPVARAYSNYWERVGSGAESLPTFEQAIDAEQARTSGEVERIAADPSYYSFDHDCHTYLARGRYAEHLAPWLDLFPRDQLLIMRSEDLYRDEAEAYARVQRFLGVPVRSVPQLPRYNRLPVDPIEPETKQRLQEYYAPHNEALAELLGEKEPWWVY